MGHIVLDLTSATGPLACGVGTVESIVLLVISIIGYRWKSFTDLGHDFVEVILDCAAH